MEFSLSELKQKLAELGIQPKKALGQNFLVNKSSCQRIVEAVRNLNPTKIVEVGPGLGALTTFFKPEEILLIELDSAISQYWRELGYEVREEDALHTDWNALDLPQGSILMSNLPYQISSRLVIDRGLGPSSVQGMVLMFQKEVAQRLMARPNSEAYGLLTVVASNFWEIQKLFEISSKDFFPPPQVASQVLVFRRKTQTPATGFVEFVKLAFAQRRKFLVKNLAARYSQADVRQGLLELSVDEKARAEVLSPEQFLRLYNKLSR